jgi:hypothetical protein
MEEVPTHKRATAPTVPTKVRLAEPTHKPATTPTAPTEVRTEEPTHTADKFMTWAGRAQDVCLFLIQMVMIAAFVRYVFHCNCNPVRFFKEIYPNMCVLVRLFWLFWTPVSPYYNQTQPTANTTGPWVHSTTNSSNSTTGHMMTRLRSFWTPTTANSSNSTVQQLSSYGFLWVQGLRSNSSHCLNENGVLVSGCENKTFSNTSEKPASGTASEPPKNCISRENLTWYQPGFLVVCLKDTIPKTPASKSTLQKPRPKKPETWGVSDIHPDIVAAFLKSPYSKDHCMNVRGEIHPCENEPVSYQKTSTCWNGTTGSVNPCN